MVSEVKRPYSKARPLDGRRERPSSNGDEGDEKMDDESDDETDDLTSLTDRDRDILFEEDEREKLLSKLPSQGELKRTDHRLRGVRKRKKHNGHERAELIYEMEEGSLRDDSSSQSESSSLELELESERLNHGEGDRFKKTMKFTIIVAAIAALFCVLAFGAYRVTSTSRRLGPVAGLLSNGSSSFAPTTILISLDGFRADFLRRGITPTLNGFIAEGVSPQYMLPSFPSVTFPNHYTLVTGLYPESHGVVGNSFWDPKLEEEFYYTDPARSMQPKWWLGGEPLWVTAEKQNVRTAIHMWPGSEAHITMEPSFLDKYNGTELLSRKVVRILELLDTEALQRPQFIAAYVPVVDAAGHLYGPNSTEIRTTIASVDEMLHDLFAGLDQRNLTEIVNIVVVSDHGMASTSTDRLVQLDDLIDLELVEHIDGWPLYGLRPKDPNDLHLLYNQLKAESIQNPNFDVYLRDQDMPERYHFSKNERIAPLWVIPKTGWAIVHKEDFDVHEAKLRGETYHPKGLHGYDHEHPLMRAIFVARGPAFPHEPNSKLDVFQNTEVYNIVCDSLGIEPKPNNGTLRLPLKPIGFHLDEEDGEDDIQKDDAQVQLHPQTPLLVNATTTMLNKTANNATITSTDNDQNATNSAFWDFITEKLEAVKAWAESTFSKATNLTMAS